MLHSSTEEASGYLCLTPFTTQDDLNAFHTRIFGPYRHTPAIFLEAQPLTEEPEDYDDGLGYYGDGVKRTLTDEQIAMFRHSEIQSLLRDRRHRTENMDTSAKEEEDVGSSASPLAEEVDSPLDEDEEEEYARFLEEERRQMERDAANLKRKRSVDVANETHGREATHRRIARELDANLESNESLDYGEEAPRPIDSGRLERTEDLYQRRTVDYTDDTGEKDVSEAAKLSHVKSASHVGKKIWWPVIGT